MERIPASAIEEMRRRMNKLSARAGITLALRFQQEQPAAAGYLQSIEDDLYDEAERAHLFFMGLVVWQIMKDSGDLPRIDDEAIHRAEDANTALLDKYDANPQLDSRHLMTELLAGYPQPELLRSVLQTLVAPDQRAEAEPVLDDHHAVIMFFDLKTIIDALCGAVPVRARRGQRGGRQPKAKRGGT